MIGPRLLLLFFFFNDTATTEIYTLSLHDALPILRVEPRTSDLMITCETTWSCSGRASSGSTHSYNRSRTDRKSTRLNSSHQIISYAVFCLKKKKKRRTVSTAKTTRPHINSGDPRP